MDAPAGRVNPRAARHRPERLSRQEKKAETRRRLLDAAEVVFRRRGFTGASVEEITAEAGFSRGAFYSNFDTKEELFVELLHDRIFAGYRRMLERLPADATPVEQLRWGAQELMERQRRDEDRWLFELFLECIAHAVRNPAFASLAATFWSGNRAVLATLIERNFAQLVRPGQVKAKQLATAVIAVDVGLAIQHLVDPEEVPLEVYPPLFELLFGQLVDARAP